MRFSVSRTNLQSVYWIVFRDRRTDWKSVLQDDYGSLGGSMSGYDRAGQPFLEERDQVGLLLRGQLEREDLLVELRVGECRPCRNSPRPLPAS